MNKNKNTKKNDNNIHYAYYESTCCSSWMNWKNNIYHHEWTRPIQRGNKNSRTRTNTTRTNRKTNTRRTRRIRRISRNHEQAEQHHEQTQEQEEKGQGEGEGQHHEQKGEIIFVIITTNIVPKVRIRTEDCYEMSQSKKNSQRRAESTDLDFLDDCELHLEVQQLTLDGARV